jgi:alkylhydroperoxidase family enzyme
MVMRLSVLGAWCVAVLVAAAPAGGPAGTTVSAYVPLLDSGSAWKHLPPAETGQGAPLPAWGRALAQALPATTAAMLELDRLHRVFNPLHPRLRGKMRWVAAHANRCLYAQEVAAADLRRAGVSEAEIANLAGDLSALPEAERRPLVFARKLTLEAYAVTDAEVADLVRRHGEKDVVAMVQLLAYANFQDRLVLALGLRPEGGMPAPLEIRFKSGAAPGIPAPPRPAPPAEQVAKVASPGADWKDVEFPALQERMELQRTRPGRIRVPTWDEVAKDLPPSAKDRPPLRIRWSLVCMGYQPELAAGWSACTRNFGQESGQDRVFQESLFWVVTRSLQCFY